MDINYLTFEVLNADFRFFLGNSRTVAISFLKMKEHLTVTVTVSHIELEMTVASLNAPR